MSLSRDVHTHYFVHVISKQKKKKNIDRNPGKRSKQKITCHFRSHACRWNTMCLLAPVIEAQQVCGIMVKAFCWQKLIPACWQGDKKPIYLFHVWAWACQRSDLICLKKIALKNHVFTFSDENRLILLIWNTQLRYLLVCYLHTDAPSSLTCYTWLEFVHIGLILHRNSFPVVDWLKQDLLSG